MEGRNDKGQFTKGRKGALEDLTSQRFGRLLVTSKAESVSGRTVWNCKCDCGNENKVYATNLKRGKTKSCGCWHDEAAKINNLIDLTGMRFGRLTVIEKAEDKNKQIMWRCKCDCGNEKCVSSGNLRSGCTKSCGCLHDEVAKISKKTHGMSKTRIYRIYKEMYARCYSPKRPEYPDYGGRGIAICDEWLDEENGFMNFYNWAMANGYADNLTIDRINKDGNYEPSNCRWATAKEQARNTRNTVFLTYKGETKSVPEWSEIIGISKDTLTYRKRSGWSDKDCIEIPVYGTFRRKRKK